MKTASSHLNSVQTHEIVLHRRVLHAPRSTVVCVITHLSTTMDKIAFLTDNNGKIRFALGAKWSCYRINDMTF